MANINGSGGQINEMRVSFVDVKLDVSYTTAIGLI